MIPIRFGFFLSGSLLAVKLMGWADLSARLVLAPLLFNIGWNLGEFLADYLRDRWREWRDG
jgi:hypothetical protein